MNFKLDNWQTEYIKDIAKYADNPKIAEKLRNVFPNPYTLADAEWYVNDCIKNAGNNQLCYAITVDGKAVGSVGIFIKDDVYCKTAELGYWLGEPFWKQGIMSEAVRQICHEAFSKFDIVRIFAEPFADNTGSRKVLENAGFQLEGIMKYGVFKNNCFHDYCIYALLKLK